MAAQRQKGSGHEAQKSKWHCGRSGSTRSRRRSSRVVLAVPVLVVLCEQRVTEGCVPACSTMPGKLCVCFCGRQFAGLLDSHALGVRSFSPQKLRPGTPSLRAPLHGGSCRRRRGRRTSTRWCSARAWAGSCTSATPSRSACSAAARPTASAPRASSSSRAACARCARPGPSLALAPAQPQSSPSHALAQPHPSHSPELKSEPSPNEWAESLTLSSSRAACARSR